MKWRGQPNRDAYLRGRHKLFDELSLEPSDITLRGHVAEAAWRASAISCTGKPVVFAGTIEVHFAGDLSIQAVFVDWAPADLGAELGYVRRW